MRFLVILWCILAAPATAAQSTAQSGDIAVGGLNPVATIHSLPSLAIPGNTWKLLATCRARLYLHWVGWIVLSYQERQTMAQAASHGFGGVTLESNFLSSVVTGKPVVPLAAAPITTPASIINGSANPNHDYTYFSFLAPWWIGPDEVFLNGFQDSCLNAAQSATQVSEWMRIIDQYRAAGVRTVSVIFSPNNWGTGGCNVHGSFSDPAWNAIKRVARYGGGLVLDTPPYYFFKQPDAYRAFSLEEIAWARANGVRVSVIVSPPPDDTVAESAYARQTRELVEKIQDASKGDTSYLPDEWVAEDYNPFQDPADPTVPGSEDSPDTVTAVALWLARHAPTAETPKPE
jgi:hypothetical protein